MKNNLYYEPKIKKFRLDCMSSCQKYGFPSDVRIEPNDNGLYKVKFGTFATINDRLDWHYFDVWFTQQELDYIGFEEILRVYCLGHNFKLEESKEKDDVGLCYIQKTIQYCKEKTIHWYIQHIEIPKEKYDKIKKDLEVLKEYETY